MADALDLSDLQKRLESCTRTLDKMSRRVAEAKQVREYDSDRRKRILALAQSGFLAKGESAAKAESLARATDEYGKALDDLSSQYENAETTILEYESERTKWEACRTLISMLKNIAHSL